MWCSLSVIDAPLVEREIATVLCSRFVGKVGKYVVKLAFPGAKAKEYWMSRKQLLSLLELFGKTPNGYSCVKCRVIGHFTQEGYYAFCSIKKHHFEPPVQHDLSDLIDN